MIAGMTADTKTNREDAAETVGLLIESCYFKEDRYILCYKPNTVPVEMKQKQVRNDWVLALLWCKFVWLSAVDVRETID